MAQDVKTQLTALLQQALASVAPTATETTIHLERPRDPTHGDFATNLAMQLAKALKKNPREIANQLLGDFTRIFLQRLGQLHGQVGRKVAVRRIARTLKLNRGIGCGRCNAGQRLLQKGGQLGFDV